MSERAYEGLIVLNYRLTRKLGAGGFGIVYLAEHIELGRRAACKILYPEFVRRRDLVERFFNEAKAACTIGHRSIIDIQNFGTLQSGEPFYLMEYFEGFDLSTYVKRHGPLSFADAVAVFDPIAQALSAAHAKHVIHRDLKPENILLRQEAGRVAQVKLLDFGIAKLLDSSDSSASRTGVAMGTPKFMAPEQARDAKNVDQRADVYGFAATLFCLHDGSSTIRAPEFHRFGHCSANSAAAATAPFFAQRARCARRCPVRLHGEGTRPPAQHDRRGLEYYSGCHVRLPAATHESRVRTRPIDGENACLSGTLAA